MELLGGNRGHGGRSRGALAIVAAAATLALSLTACGGDSEESNAGEPSASYPVAYTAGLPAQQRLGETSLLQIGVRNVGEKRMPDVTVNISIAGEEGQSSGLPFGIRDPQPELAQPDRPVWVLADRYPKLAGSTESAGAETTSGKTYGFGPLEPGEEIEAVWKLSAVKAGSYRLRYEIGAGLGGRARAEAQSGEPAKGALVVRIAEAPPNTVVTDSGEVVPAPEDPTQANR